MSSNLKRAIRARMADTGETYSTARMRVLEERDVELNGAARRLTERRVEGLRRITPTLDEVLDVEVIVRRPRGDT